MFSSTAKSFCFSSYIGKGLTNSLLLHLLNSFCVHENLHMCQVHMPQQTQFSCWFCTKLPQTKQLKSTQIYYLMDFWKLEIKMCLTGLKLVNRVMCSFSGALGVNSFSCFFSSSRSCSWPPPKPAISGWVFLPWHHCVVAKLCRFLWLYGLQHSRLSCSSLPTESCSVDVHWVSDAI